MLLYKVLMIHDQHNVSLVEYVYDARIWYVSPFMTKCNDFMFQCWGWNHQCYQPFPACRICQLRVDVTPWAKRCIGGVLIITNNATYSSGIKCREDCELRSFGWKWNFQWTHWGFMGDLVTLNEKFMQSVQSLCLLKTSPKGWLINDWAFTVRHWSLECQNMPNTSHRWKQNIKHLKNLSLGPYDSYDLYRI